jgi:hypothetical protein
MKRKPMTKRRRVFVGKPRDARAPHLDDQAEGLTPDDHQMLDEILEDYGEAFQGLADGPPPVGERR